MSDEVTEVTSESWFGRIMDSIKGILVGIILIPVAAPEHVAAAANLPNNGNGLAVRFFSTRAAHATPVVPADTGLAPSATP